MAIVHFAGSDNFEREFPDGAPLQNAIDSSKADIMFGCREGSCATCMIEVLSGRENLSRPPTKKKPRSSTTSWPKESVWPVRREYCAAGFQFGAPTVVSENQRRARDRSVSAGAPRCPQERLAA